MSSKFVSDYKKIASFFSFKRVLFPIAIGMAVASYLIIKEIDLTILDNIRWTSRSYLWLFMALMMVVLRDLGYMIRIRILTQNQLSWGKSFNVIMLWEFASALTPSVVGGSAVAMLILNKEKIPLGRSTAVVMVTALLDELFYIIVVPLVLILVAGSFDVFAMKDLVVFGMKITAFNIFLIGYLFIVTLTLIISYAIFINPRGFKWFLVYLFKFKIIRKWRYGALLTGTDLVTSAKEMKGKSLVFWLKAFGATALSWTARFTLVNFLILAFLPVDNHLHIYASQLVMWVIMLISPTPGGSGIAEIIFNDFLSPFIIVGLTPILGFFWRLLSFYIYLIIGSLVLPVWLQKVFRKSKIDVQSKYD